METQQEARGKHPSVEGVEENGLMLTELRREHVRIVIDGVQLLLSDLPQGA